MGRSSRVIPEGGRVASAWFVSILAHLVALGLGGLLVAASLGRRGQVEGQARPALPQDDTVEIELPTVVDGSLLVNPTPLRDPPPVAVARGGGEAMPRLDTGHKGRGGDDTSPTPALNLADRDDDMLLSPEVMSRLDRSQIQRLRASSRRASREDWRASREPMELTFLAMGHDAKSTRPEHRRPAAFDPSSGGRSWGPAQREGGALGAADLPVGVGESARQVGGPVEGGEHASSGRGVRDGAPGHDSRDTARVANARPMVNEGTPSVPSNVRDRPTDNQDSEQEIATRMQSILGSSNAGGSAGVGRGGQAGAGPAGAGGTVGPGSTAHALGTGQGDGIDVDPRDRRRLDYIRQIHAKLAPYTAWRKLISVSAAVDGVQGVVVVTCTILADGTVAAATLTRTSGVPELDENYRRAILKAAPFGPLPPELGTTFRLALPLDMRNPAVRPRSAKPDKAAPSDR